MTDKHQVNDESEPRSLTPGTQQMYEAALRQNAATPHELGGLLGLPPAAADTVFERLRALNLLQPAEGRPGAYDWCTPQVAEARTLGPLRHQLQAVQDHIDAATVEFAALREVYDAAAADEQGGEPDFLLLDAADVNVMLDKAATDCESDLLTAQPGGPRPVEVLNEALARDSELLARGVRMRTIYQHSARFSPATESYAERLTKAGAEIRTLNTLFPRLIVFDHRTAFIQAGDGSAALLVRHPEVVAFMVSTFEAAWRTAIPFASAYESRRQKLIVSDMQRAIARLLLREDKDAAIARHLGISERTCRQHIAKLMAQLGARNRTHLGFLLATEMSLPREPVG
ncbi:LuxR C-terminal-related transcriptional regulator [Streptomyces sp. NPDC002926]